MECLVRAHAILAHIVSPASADYTGHVLKSYFCVVRLLHHSIDNANQALKEIQKTGDTQSDPKKKPDPVKKPVREKSGTKKKNEANSVLPNSVEQWSQFEVSDEISSAWNHELMKRTGINQTTIIEPYMLFNHLDSLGNKLSELGLAQLIFPVLNLQLILVNCVLKSDMEQSQLVSMNAYLRFKLINLCIMLNLLGSVNFHQQALANIVNPATNDPNQGQQGNTMNPAVLLKLIQIDPFEVCAVREQIYNLKQRLSQLEDDEANMADKSSSSFSTNSRKSPNNFKESNGKNKKKQPIKTNTVSLALDGFKEKKPTLQKAHDLKLPGEQRKIHNNLPDALFKDVWILMAEQLVAQGHMQTARDFLHESLNASIVRHSFKSLFYLE